MNKSIYILTVAAAALVTAVASCGDKRPQRYDEGSTTLYADEGFQSFIEQEREVFEYQYPNAYILTKYMSETDAINGLLSDSCTMAVLSRKLTKEQLEYIRTKNNRVAKQQELAVDAVVLIVNKDNPVNMLSVGEIQELFNGTITSWRQLAWNDTTPIKLVFDREGSANVNYIQDRFLANGAEFPANAYAQKSTADVIKLVEKDKSAIGFVSVSWLGSNLDKIRTDLSKEAMDTQKLAGLNSETDTIAVDFTDKVKILKVRKDDDPVGYKPYQAYISSGDYPLYRVVYIVSTATNNSVGQSFFSFVTGFTGQKILSLTGIMPYQVHNRIVELN